MGTDKILDLEVRSWNGTKKHISKMVVAISGVYNFVFKLEKKCKYKTTIVSFIY